MAFVKTAVAAYGSTALFVLLWSSGAIVSKLGLDHAPAFAFLVLRFALASSVLAMLAYGAGAGCRRPERVCKSRSPAHC